MSQGQANQPGHTQPTPNPADNWRKILDLGRSLLSLTPSDLLSKGSQPGSSNFPDGGVMPVQAQLISAAAAEIFGGEAGLWLTRRLGREAGYLRAPTGDLMLPAHALDGLFVEQPEHECARRAWQPPYDLAQGQNALALPLLDPARSGMDDRLLGVLLVQRSAGPAFQASEIELLEALALQASIALQIRRQGAIDRWQAEQRVLISKVGHAVTSILDQDELLAGVVALIHDLFEFPLIHLYSVHPGRRKIFLEAGSSPASQALIRKNFAYDLDDLDGILPWVARQGQTALVNDTSRDGRFRPAAINPEVTQAELAVPLKFGGEVLGILDIHSDRQGAFGDAEQFLFEALADDIAIALRNAALYRSEKWRRQAADSLREVAGMLSAQVELDQVLNAILVELERSLPCELAAIWFMDDELDDAGRSAGLPALRLAAVHGSGADWLQPQLGLGLDEIIELSGFLDPPDFAAPGWLIEAAESDEPVIRPAGSPQDMVGLTLEFPMEYSAIAAPLRAGEHRLGMLTLAHSTAGRYGSEARAMSAAFASYAAVAIQNARLFASAHEQIWTSSVLLQVAESTQSETELADLLEMVARLLPMLVGVRACAVYMLDDDEAFVPAAESGLAAASRAEFTSRRFLVGEIPALDQLRVEKRPIVVPTRGANAALTRLISAEPDDQPALQFLIGVPLAAHGDILGALLVQYTHDPVRTGLHELENFFDEKMSILQGIAHQASTAIENIHLARAQQEEAYISVAFLQVAQAIVSSGNLQETLASIARVTPILTGVKRVGFYLPDQDCRCFRLAEAYGMPDTAALYEYATDEFPLLQAAWTQDSLVVHPLDVKIPGMNLEWDDIPEVWSQLPALAASAAVEQGQAEPESVLERAERLILALPLSVKGVVVGVMLAEEPGPATGAAIGRQGTNTRLRAKRLEILTGISQQAAIAIQNDQFQREMVVRERLERELQLAREIQQAFLPDRLPRLPGWQINVWWRTAREMGGDFYDLIELPDGKWGIVIADVADKGLPAALFMTSIRAMLRATVCMECSPDEVLNAVNLLLIPDTKQSTFVTIFYGVLDPLTGELAYANAGHNPPLWVRKAAGQIELLTRSGMALGVQAESLVEQRTISLSRGDFLVLYTDGATDAVSPQGVIYDFERLYQAVWDTAFENGSVTASANEMLEAIDQSIKAFVDNAPDVDDSTALVFYFEGN